MEQWEAGSRRIRPIWARMGNRVGKPGWERRGLASLAVARAVRASPRTPTSTSAGPRSDEIRVFDMRQPTE